MSDGADDLLKIIIGVITGAMVVGLFLFVLYTVYDALYLGAWHGI